MKYILFDLDGTLTDPFLGITSAVAYGLKSQGIKPPELEQLKPFIGPPLDDSFARFYGMDNETCWKAIDKFREYFDKIGKFENEVYDGIEECLKALNEHGYKLYVCTSKPIFFASQIMEHFHLNKYFKGIYGSELDGTRKEKAKVIQYCLVQENIDFKECIMVGDRIHDVIGAHENGISCIGVLYGYGDREEFTSCQCDYIVESVRELEDFLINERYS